jgi:hypothetical protein
MFRGRALFAETIEDTHPGEPIQWVPAPATEEQEQEQEPGYTVEELRDLVERMDATDLGDQQDAS